MPTVKKTNGLMKQAPTAAASAAPPAASAGGSRRAADVVDAAPPPPAAAPVSMVADPALAVRLLTIKCVKNNSLFFRQLLSV
jgi:hypothetical protein